MTLQVTLRESIHAAGGVLLAAGTVQSFADDVAAGLVRSNKAAQIGPGWEQPGGVETITNPEVLTLRESANAGLLTAESETLAMDLTTAAQVESSTAAISTTAALSFVATQTSRRVRVAWVDLKFERGATTDATGYALGTKTITLASAGTGALYKGDVITFAGQLNEYTLLSGDSDVSNGGTITLAGYGLAAAIPASATAITLVRRGCRAFLALDCDNAVEGLIATQDERQRDAELVLGQSIVIQSPDPISSLWASAEVSVLSANHRLDVVFGD
jgi:hypothetical protein